MQEGARHSKSLLNTFPFSLAENNIDETNTISRQGDGGVDFNDVAEAASTGQRCIDKVKTLLMNEIHSLKDVFPLFILNLPSPITYSG